MSNVERPCGRPARKATGKRLANPSASATCPQPVLLFSFYLIESGMLRASYLFLDRTHSICESMVAGTISGEMSFLSRTKRNATVVAERDSVLWKMEVASHEEMGRKEGWAFCRRFEQCLMRIAAEEQEGAFGRSPRKRMLVPRADSVRFGVFL